MLINGWNDNNCGSMMDITKNDITYKEVIKENVEDIIRVFLVNG